MADFAFLDGRVVAGDQGEGVLIEQILVREGDKKGEEEAYIEFLGTAKTVLKDGFNPAAGFDELPEPIPVSDRVKVVLADKQASNEILYDRLNKTFRFDPPLVDSEDSWERFLEGSENSIHNTLKGGRLYFTAKKNPTKTGEKPSDFYYNAAYVAKRKEGTMSEGGAAIKAIIARKKAKQGAAPNFTAD